MYSPEQSHNTVYLRLGTIDKAVELLEKAFAQQQSIDLVDSAPIVSTEAEPEIYINNVESARRVVDKAYGVNGNMPTEPKLAIAAEPNFTEDIDTPTTNLEELFKAANGVNK